MPGRDHATLPVAGPRSTSCENRCMDIERINQIGSLLADLSTRTQQLRGYL